ncbi:unnamed protein product, partial [Acanthoscelides obtectus]
MHCVNCEGEHAANSRACPKMKEEIAIQKVRTMEKLSYLEAKKKVIRPIPQKSYSEIAATTSWLRLSYEYGIYGSGTATFVADVFGDTKNISLHKAFHVPDLRVNLLSVAKITDKGFEVLFKKENALIYDSNGDIKVVADRSGDLYYAREGEAQNKSAFISTMNSKNVKLWHRRLGHLNFQDLNSSLKKGRLGGINIENMPNNGELNCEICIRGKMTRSPFPKKSDRESEMLEIVHTDVCGPMRVESHSKYKYFVEFIDDYS